MLVLFASMVAVRNVLICRQPPLTCRDDVALEDAWHEEVETKGVTDTMISISARCYLRWLR